MVEAPSCFCYLFSSFLVAPEKKKKKHLTMVCWLFALFLSLLPPRLRLTDRPLSVDIVIDARNREDEEGGGTTLLTLTYSPHSCVIPFSPLPLPICHPRGRKKHSSSSWRWFFPRWGEERKKMKRVNHRPIRRRSIMKRAKPLKKMKKMGLADNNLLLLPTELWVCENWELRTTPHQNWAHYTTYIRIEIYFNNF